MPSTRLMAFASLASAAASSSAGSPYSWPMPGSPGSTDYSASNMASNPVTYESNPVPYTYTMASTPVAYGASKPEPVARDPVAAPYSASTMPANPVPYNTNTYTNTMPSNPVYTNDPVAAPYSASTSTMLSSPVPYNTYTTTDNTYTNTMPSDPVPYTVSYTNTMPSNPVPYTSTIPSSNPFSFTSLSSLPSCASMPAWCVECEPCIPCIGQYTDSCSSCAACTPCEPFAHCISNSLPSYQAPPPAAAPAAVYQTPTHTATHVQLATPSHIDGHTTHIPTTYPSHHTDGYAAHIPVATTYSSHHNDVHVGGVKATMVVAAKGGGGPGGDGTYADITTFAESGWANSPAIRYPTTGVYGGGVYGGRSIYGGIYGYSGVYGGARGLNVFGLNGLTWSAYDQAMGSAGLNSWDTQHIVGGAVAGKVMKSPYSTSPYPSVNVRVPYSTPYTQPGNLRTWRQGDATGTAAGPTFVREA